MKKILSAALMSTILAGSIFADGPSPVFNGFYLGGGLTYVSEKIKPKIAVTLNGIPGQVNAAETFRGAGVKAFCGYGIFVYQEVYLGGELGLGIDRILGTNKGKVIDSGNNVNYSIAARLGYGISNVLPYVKLGYEGRPSMKVLNTFNINRSTWVSGAGVDIGLYVNIFLRAEYMHGFSTKTNISGSGTFWTFQASGQGKAKASSDTFLLGAAYKF